MIYIFSNIRQLYFERICARLYLRSSRTQQRADAKSGNFTLYGCDFADIHTIYCVYALFCSSPL